MGTTPPLVRVGWTRAGCRGCASLTPASPASSQRPSTRGRGSHPPSLPLHATQGRRRGGGRRAPPQPQAQPPPSLSSRTSHRCSCPSLASCLRGARRWWGPLAAAVGAAAQRRGRGEGEGERTLALAGCPLPPPGAPQQQRRRLWRGRRAWRWRPARPHFNPLPLPQRCPGAQPSRRGQVEGEGEGAGLPPLPTSPPRGQRVTPPRPRQAACQPTASTPRRRRRHSPEGDGRRRTRRRARLREGGQPLQGPTSGRLHPSQEVGGSPLRLVGGRRRRTGGGRTPLPQSKTRSCELLPDNRSWTTGVGNTGLPYRG